ncbi:MAG: 2-hydroxychromene-2-carboxylate isomerase [Candidatus Pelagibacter sp. TMED106]|jgi:2-hydroxychromene-2-carboxylate isomerase|nr:MAG: 2-hydroxychromene-2-carboxylate isomerase [Candidatus Pelagibacter sp. TMED106]|tara:strand:+ start:413 stop:997 length:585 start_codon:yes stop_codon:yes gene_type:complete
MIDSIEFYFDFISPYSYLAHKKIRFLQKNKEIKITYKPILLGGLHNLEGITPPAFIKSKLNFMIRDCNMVAKKKNIPFTFNSKFPINSIKLMRGFLIIDKKIQNKYLDIMFDAYWRDNLDVGDEEILNKLIKECKINKDLFQKKIKEQTTKDKLRQNTQIAFEKEIFGAPTFVVSNQIFWGQDRLEYALDEYFN